jgi:hypothetical protein
LKTKEQEKIKKVKKLEQKRLQAEEEYQKNQDEDERIKRENDIKSEYASLQKKKDEEEAKRLANEEKAKNLVDEAEAKQLAEEVEAKRKANKQLKQQKSQELSKDPSGPSTPNLGIVNIPPQEYTPLNVILGDSTFSSQVLNFEGTVVVVLEIIIMMIEQKSLRRDQTRKKGENPPSLDCLQEEFWSGKLVLTHRRMLFKKLLPSMHSRD